MSADSHHSPPSQISSLRKKKLFFPEKCSFIIKPKSCRLFKTNNTTKMAASMLCWKAVNLNMQLHRSAERNGEVQSGNFK